MELNIDKHALRLSHLSVMQQQRALKALAQKQRAYNKTNKANAESSEANTYDWHRKVRLAREARGYNLIRAFLKGMPYKTVEQSNKVGTISPIFAVEYASAVPWYNNFRMYQSFVEWLEADD